MGCSGTTHRHEAGKDGGAGRAGGGGVAHFHGAMPTGVTVSHRDGIFVNFPKWGDDVPGSPWPSPPRTASQVAYPDEATNRTDPDDPGPPALVSVQSVVVDPADRLWILDTGSPLFRPTRYGGPKLMCVDLERAIGWWQTILFTPRMSPCRRRTSTTCASTCAERGSPEWPTSPTRPRTGPTGSSSSTSASGESLAAPPRSPLRPRRRRGWPALPPPGGGAAFVEAQAGDGSVKHGRRHGLGRDRHRRRRGAPVLLPPGQPAALQRGHNDVLGRPHARRERTRSAPASSRGGQGSGAPEWTGERGPAASPTPPTTSTTPCCAGRPGRGVGDGRPRRAPLVAGHPLAGHQRLPLRHGQPAAPAGALHQGTGPRATPALHALPRPGRQPACQASLARRPQRERRNAYRPDSTAVPLSLASSRRAEIDGDGG